MQTNRNLNNARARAERKLQHHSRTRSTLHQHNPYAITRCGAEGEFGSPWLATRRRADGLRSLDTLPAAQPAKSQVGESRSISAFSRTRINVALLVASSDRLRSCARRVEKLSAVGFKDAGPSRIWSNAWR